MNSIDNAQNPTTTDVDLLAEAYETVLPKLVEYPADKLLVVNADPVAIVTAALGTLPRMFAQREALSELKDFDLEDFDQLEIYARALNFAHLAFQLASQPPDELKRLQEEVNRLRELFLNDVSSAIARGLLPSDALDDLRGANGYRNTAHDLQLLTMALRQNWDKLEGKIFTTKEELTTAGDVAYRLLRAYGLRENGPEGIADVADKRTRAFSLFVSAYEDARLAITYVRRKMDDGDKIAPSLYVFRTHARKKGEAEVEPAGDTPAQAPAAPAAPVEPAGAATPVAKAVNPADPYA